MITYISGGVRSGKSSYAQRIALELSENPVYVATARIWDEDFKKRIEKHQAERGPEWTSLEAEQQIHLLPLENRVVVIDCVTLWLTNLFMTYESNVEKTLAAFKTEINSLEAIKGTFIIISNEIGMGIHADTDIGRKFADLQGWANQYVAMKADQAILMVSGLPLVLKQGLNQQQ